MNLIRTAVSKNKKRLVQEGFNLDLTYITPNIIAMGWPSEGKEATYRNPMVAVQKFFKKYHDGKYKVYNLCSERTYDPKKFEDRVHVAGFPDHNPPPLKLIHPLCEDIRQWLSEDEKNVVAIHCKAGKGRTGTIISCFLLHDGVFESADDALKFFGMKRTSDGKGVTIPSQQRYVRYYEACLKHGFPQGEDAQLQLSKIKIEKSPNFSCTLGFYIEQNGKLIFDSDSEDMLISFKPNRETLPFLILKNLTLAGDIKVIFYNSKERKKEKLFWFWFNTNMIENNFLCLTKNEIDNAVKDKSDKYPSDFKISVFFEKTKNVTVPKKMMRKRGVSVVNVNAKTPNHVQSFGNIPVREIMGDGLSMDEETKSDELPKKETSTMDDDIELDNQIKSIDIEKDQIEKLKKFVALRPRHTRTESSYSLKTESPLSIENERNEETKINEKDSNEKDLNEKDLKEKDSGKDDNLEQLKLMLKSQQEEIEQLKIQMQRQEECLRKILQQLNLEINL